MEKVKENVAVYHNTIDGKNNAESLNREADDVLLYQNIDSFEKDFEQLTSQDFAIMHGTTVSFNLEDIVFDNNDKRLNPVLGKVHSV